MISEQAINANNIKTAYIIREKNPKSNPLLVVEYTNGEKTKIYGDDEISEFISSLEYTKLDYTCEETFITEEIKIANNHLSFAESIRSSYESGKTSPLMVHKDKESLLFITHHNDEKFRVVIEKI